jgi:hypothetical protein
MWAIGQIAEVVGARGRGRVEEVEDALRYAVDKDVLKAKAWYVTDVPVNGNQALAPLFM